MVSVDGEGNRTTFDYDPAGQMVAEHRGDGTTISYGYWPDGSLASRTDGAGAVTRYDYDALGRPTTTTDPLGRVSHQLRRGGQPSDHRAPRGRLWRLARPGLHHLLLRRGRPAVAVDHSDPAIPDVAAITYDANGRRSAMVDGSGTSTWDWDSLGRLVASTDGAGATLA